MLKIITLVTKFIIVTLAALLFASCNMVSQINGIKGSGHVTTEKRIVNGNFTQVSVSNAIDLVLEQSDKVEIIVEADDNLQDGITTQISNGKLEIGCKYNGFNNITSKKVIVRAPLIESIEASSAATASNLGIIKSNEIRIDGSSAASIDLNIEAEKILCDASSASKISLKGKGLNASYSTSSAGTIKAADLFINDIQSKASSGSHQIINPRVNLIAEASSGASIKYKNKPISLSKDTSSGGSVSQE